LIFSALKEEFRSLQLHKEAARKDLTIRAFLFLSIQFAGKLDFYICGLGTLFNTSLKTNLSPMPSWNASEYFRTYYCLFPVCVLANPSVLFPWILKYYRYHLTTVM
jgi:hypothetical protein